MSSFLGREMARRTILNPGMLIVRTPAKVETIAIRQNPSQKRNGEAESGHADQPGDVERRLASPASQRRPSSPPEPPARPIVARWDGRNAHLTTVNVGSNGRRQRTSS